MYVVSVESARNGELYPIRYGAITDKLHGEEDGALALARMLSSGIGRDNITVKTVNGEEKADAIVVTTVKPSSIAWRFIDGMLMPGTN